MPTDPAPHLATLLTAAGWTWRAGWWYSPEYRPLDGTDVHVESGAGDLIHWHVTARVGGLVVAYDASPPSGSGEQDLIDALCVMALPDGAALPREHHSLYRTGMQAGYLRGYEAGLRVCRHADGSG